MLDKYFQLLPSYQDVPLEQLKFKRILFAGLPCYQNGPLQTSYDRIVQASRILSLFRCQIALPLRSQQLPLHSIPARLTPESDLCT